MGDLGCMLAYFYVCKRVVDECIPWVFVCEDDVIFNPLFEKRLSTMDLADYVCSDWTFVHPNHGYSTLGQIITYVGAKKVLQHSTAILQVGMGIDLVLFSDLIKNFHYAVCYGTDAWLVDQEAPYNNIEYSERMKINKNNEMQ